MVMVEVVEKCDLSNLERTTNFCSGLHLNIIEANFTYRKNVYFLHSFILLSLPVGCGLLTKQRGYGTRHLNPIWVSILESTLVT